MKKETKLDIFSENAKIVADEIMVDRELYGEKVLQKKELKNSFNNENVEKTSTDIFSQFSSKEKMDVILDKIKNKNK